MNGSFNLLQVLLQHSIHKEAILRHVSIDQVLRLPVVFIRVYPYSVKLDCKAAFRAAAVRKLYGVRYRLTIACMQLDARYSAYGSNSSSSSPVQIYRFLLEPLLLL